MVKFLIKSLMISHANSDQKKEKKLLQFSSKDRLKISKLIVNIFTVMQLRE